jgi:hypothetical protein
MLHEISQVRAAGVSGLKNILIVDSDLGFIFWLAKVLVEARHQPWPACSAMDAVAVVNRRHLAPLDLLVINPSLQGASHLIRDFRRKQPNLKVLAVDPLNDRQVRGVNAWRARPHSADQGAKEKWMQEIDRIFSSHHRAA